MVEFRVLGPVQVLDEGEPVEIPQARLRALLAVLLLHANEIVSREQLIDALWGERPPEKAGNALQASVSRLRKQLATDAGREPLVRTHPPGYLISIDPAQLDLTRFERLVAEGREALRHGDPEHAARLLRDALAVWHGPALADLTTEAFALREAERLEESRLVAVELRIEADLARGEQAALVPELESLASLHPYREGFHAQLMLAFYRAGRQAEALGAFQRLRALLADELGIEPSRSLQELERAILNQDPTLELPRAAAARLAEARAARRVDAVTAVTEATRAEAYALESELASSLAELQDARERGAPALAVAESRTAVCPFKGLAPFEEDDAEFFFGREGLLSEVVARAAGSHLVCIAGPSGSGKSSLLRAGVVPALARGVLPGSEEWARIVFRPSEHPLAALRSELESAVDGRRLVAVDQLEETFTLCEDEAERTAFLDELAAAALGSPRTLVLTAVRADFYGHLTSSPALAALLGTGTVLVGPMGEEELRRAIEAPSRRAGLSLEPGLAETLVAEALDEPGALPLLQTSLLELWKEREDATLTLRTYGRTGGLRGAVARLAEEACGALEPAEQEGARLILLRLADEEGGSIVRRRATVAELGADEDPVRARALERLAGSRLVILDDGTAEVAHEALFREWPRLRAWLDEDAENRVVRRALSEAAAAWDTGGRDPGDLYRGARLASTLGWAGERPGELTAVESEFLSAAQAEAEAETARQKRTNRRLRGLLGGVLALLALAVVAGVVALAQRSSAQESATEATAQRLGAQGLVEGDLDRSLLLARQAVDLDASARTHGNLLAALLRSPAAIRVARPLSGRILGLTGSRASTTVTVTSNEGEVALIDPLARRTIATTSADAGFLSADGRTVWIYRRGGAYELLDAETGESVHTGRLPGMDDGVRAWHVSADFGLVSIVPGDGSRVTLWRRSDGSKAGEIAAPEGHEVVDAFLFPDGRRMLTMTVPAPASFNPDELESMTFTVWDTASGEPVRTLESQPAFPALAFSPDGRVLAVAGEDFAVRLHDLDSGAVRELAGGHTAPVQGISFSADGARVATGADDKTALVWSARTGEILERLEGHNGRVFAPVFGPGGLLFTGGLDGSLVAWDLRGARRLGRPFAAPGTAPSIVPAFDVSPDGELITFGGAGGTVEIRDAETLRRRTTLRMPEGDATAVAFSPDGTLLATGTDRATVLVWDTGTWAQSGQPLPGVERPVEGSAKVTSLAFTVDGARLVAGTDEEVPVPGSDPDLDGTVYVWDLESRAQAREPIDSPGHVFDVAVSPDGSTVAAIVEAPEWDARPELEPMGWAVAWSLDDGEELYRMDADGEGFGRPGGLAFSPGGTVLAVGGGDGNVRFVDSSTGQESGRPVRASAGWVLSIDYAPDGRSLVTGATDGTVRLFDADGRFEIGTSFPGIDNFWVRAMFTPGAEHVFSLHDDGHGFRWDVAPARWAERACSVAGRTLTEEEWERFLPGRRYAPACR